MLNRQFWNRYAIAYRKLIGFWAPHQQMFRDVAVALGIKSSMRVLDAGCGAGDFEVSLHKQGIEPQIEALDFSPRMLEGARRKCRKFKGITFRKADLSDPLPFPDNYFDTITCLQTLFAMPSPRFTLTELVRVLKPGGKIAIVEPRPEFSSGKIFRYHLEAQNTCKLVSLLKLVPYLPLIWLTIKCNEIISQECKAFSDEEIIGLVERSGMQVIYFAKTLADQDHLLIAQKVDNEDTVKWGPCPFLYLLKLILFCWR